MADLCRVCQNEIHPCFRDTGLCEDCYAELCQRRSVAGFQIVGRDSCVYTHQVALFVRVIAPVSRDSCVSTRASWPPETLQALFLPCSRRFSCRAIGPGTPCAYSVGRPL